MAGRPKLKDGRTINIYLAVDVIQAIDETKGKLSRSQFIEEAVKYYISHLADNPKGEEGERKDLNVQPHYAGADLPQNDKKGFEKRTTQKTRAGGREVMRGTADPVYSGSNPDLPFTRCI